MLVFAPASKAMIVIFSTSFADAAAGRAAYPISPTERLADIAALEAIGKSAASEQIVEVQSIDPSGRPNSDQAAAVSAPA